VFHISIWGGLGALFGGDKPTKAPLPRVDETAWYLWWERFLCTFSKKFGFSFRANKHPL